MPAEPAPAVANRNAGSSPTPLGLSVPMRSTASCILSKASMPSSADFARLSMWSIFCGGCMPHGLVGTSFASRNAAATGSLRASSARRASSASAASSASSALVFLPYFSKRRLGLASTSPATPAAASPLLSVWSPRPPATALVPLTPPVARKAGRGRINGAAGVPPAPTDALAGRACTITSPLVEERALSSGGIATVLFRRPTKSSPTSGMRLSLCMRRHLRRLRSLWESLDSRLICASNAACASATRSASLAERTRSS